MCPGSSKLKKLRLVGGVDLSFVGEESNIACASLVVLSYPGLEVVYEAYERVSLHLPYIPGIMLKT